MSFDSTSFLLQSYIVNKISNYMNTSPNSNNNITICQTNNMNNSPTTNNSLGNNKLYYLLVSSILIS